MKKIVLSFLALMTLAATAAYSHISSEVISYTYGGKTFEGVMYYDGHVDGRRPGVLVVHEWEGLDDYAKRRAEELAGLGYVAFAVDMYGKGVRPANQAEAGKFSGALKKDRPEMRGRINAALETLKKSKMVDPDRVAAMGYCFGGTVALELARSGAPVRGVISFHGGLDSPTPADAAKIKGQVLVLHGADDPNVPPAQVAAFQEEMRKGKVNWELVAYGNAVHGFTNPKNGNDPSKPVAYNPLADKRSWEAMKDFFTEIFAGGNR